jgi:hypothetical protein
MPFAAVIPASDVHHDQIVAHRLQRRVIEPPARRQVGQHDARIRAGAGHQRMRQRPALRVPDVQHDRPLALVETGPIQALAVAGQGPALMVEPAADRVDANDIGAHLRQSQPGIGCRNEGGDLDDAQAFNDIGHF